MPTTVLLLHLGKEFRFLIGEFLVGDRSFLAQLLKTGDEIGDAREISSLAAYLESMRE